MKMLKKWFYRRWLHKWAGDTNIKGLPNVTMKRRFELSSFFIDMYWVMVDSNKHKQYQYYNRIDWHGVPYRTKKLEKKVITQFMREREEE